MSPPCPGCPPRSPTPWQWPLTGLSDLLLPPRAPCKQQPHHLTWLSRKKLPGGSHHWQKVASPSGRPMGPRPICPFPCRSSPTVLGSSATLFPLPRHTVCTPRGRPAPAGRGALGAARRPSAPVRTWRCRRCGACGPGSASFQIPGSGLPVPHCSASSLPEGFV